jgi:NAD(P)-dependent dehydrogenase (short-subunit alcohol dehydrogenase family)
MNVLITGASRGIGLELTRFALQKGYNVLAQARDLSNSDDLVKLKGTFNNLEIFFQDLECSDVHTNLLNAISNWSHLDILINNAGVYLDDESIEDFQKSYLVNTIKPLFISRALFEKLKKSSNPRSIQITSQMGSISDNTSGGSYSYRSSKAALNMLFKSLSIDEPWLISLLIHPGWVKTRMGGENAPLSPVISAAGIWKVIDSTDVNQNGAFVNYLGKKISW